jgi:phosphate acyltransferase
MNIGLDMMGGDFAPLEAVKGIQLYLAETAVPAHLWLTGPAEQLQPLLQEHGITSAQATVVDAPEVISYHEHPTKALKEKPRSSIAIGFGLLAKGKTDAFISAGNTGAMLVGSLFTIKAIEGVLRPTIATVVPQLAGGYSLLADVGLNADCKPENLVQFAQLCSLYARHILNIDNPRVGLVNIGEEEGKGNILAQATYPLLKENTQLNFIGNIEGRDLLTGKADVMVCEGFTGNVVLKLAESFYDIAQQRNLHHDEYLKRFHFETYGGTPVLGVSKPVIIGHGISGAVAFKNMIVLAQKMLEKDLMTKMKESFAG